MADDFSIGASITVSGLEHLLSLNENVEKALNLALGDIEATLLKIIKGRTPKGIRYQKIERTKSGKRKKGIRGKGRYVYSGAMGKSWTSELNDMVLSFTNPTQYSEILELGGYAGVGEPKTGILDGKEDSVISPRTVEGDGGIYSQQAVGGILEPLIDDTEFTNKIINAIVNEITKILGK
jgi:hypothetical protein